MSFDRKKYKQSVIAMLDSARAMNREDMLLEMLVNEAESRYKAENVLQKDVMREVKAEVKKTSREGPYDRFYKSNEDYESERRHRGEYAPHLAEDLERLRKNPELRGTPSDPDNGAYCSACGHYHYGMC